jgi:hypothetical protein
MFPVQYIRIHFFAFAGKIQDDQVRIPILSSMETNRNEEGGRTLLKSDELAL